MMETRLIPPEEIRQQVEGRVVHLAERPIPLATFLELSAERDVELVGGVLVEKIAAQLEHEKLFAWLHRVVGTYVSHRKLGIVLGSRTAVEISAYGGRLPDLLFVRRERQEIVRERAVYGAPDLVIEIVSPNDRASDLIPLPASRPTSVSAIGGRLRPGWNSADREMLVPGHGGSRGGEPVCRSVAQLTRAGGLCRGASRGMSAWRGRGQGLPCRS